MRFPAGLIVGMMVLASIAGTVSGADEEDTCAVLFDFGNGRVMWADVPVTEGMNAFNVTVEAAYMVGLDLHHEEYALGPMIDSIGGVSNGQTLNDPAWILSVWNSTSNSWESASTGASYVSAIDFKAITWKYDLWGGPMPIATPEHRYPWTSFRHDALNNGAMSDQKIDMANFTLKWSKNLKNGGIQSSIAGANGHIYVVTRGVMNEDFTFATDAKSSVFCLDASGNEVWRKNIGAGDYQAGSPLIHGGILVVPSADGKLYAFDVADGAEKWTFNTGSGSSYGITSSPIAYLNNIIVAAGNGKLFSVDAADGAENWNVTVSQVIYSSSPAIYDGVIYIGDDSGNVSAYAADGSYLWSTPVGGKIRASPLVDADNSRIVVTSGSSNGNITALYLNNGTIQWQTKIDVTSASVSLSSKGYIAATAYDLIMVDFEGDKIWNCSLGETFGGGAPTVVGDMIFVVTNEASSRLVAIDLMGKVVKETTLTPANWAVHSPTFIDGILYVASDNGYIYAFSDIEDVKNDNPWLLLGGLAAVIVIAAVGLVYWNGKRKGE